MSYDINYAALILLVKEYWQNFVSVCDDVKDAERTLEELIRQAGMSFPKR